MSKLTRTEVNNIVDVAVNYGQIVEKIQVHAVPRIQRQGDSTLTQEG